MCARRYILCKYLHDDFGNGIGVTKRGTFAPLRPGCSTVQKVDSHTAAVASDSPQGTRWVSRVPYANFYLYGALGKNSRVRYDPTARASPSGLR